MWPMKFNLSQEECRGFLRHLELESYASIVTSFRAQGSLNDEKRELLSELRDILHITTDRHKAEVRRAVNDEKLTTVAAVISGPETELAWVKEGQRIVPILPREPKSTYFSRYADKAAVMGLQKNSLLDPPCETVKDEPEEKLPISTVPVCTSNPEAVPTTGIARRFPAKGKIPAKKAIKRQNTTDANKTMAKKRKTKPLPAKLPDVTPQIPTPNSLGATAKKLSIKKKMTNGESDIVKQSRKRRATDNGLAPHAEYLNLQEYSIMNHVHELQKRLITPSVAMPYPVHISPTSKKELLSQQIIPSSKRDIASNLNKLNLYTQQQQQLQRQSLQQSGIDNLNTIKSTPVILKNPANLMEGPKIRKLLPSPAPKDSKVPAINPLRNFISGSVGNKKSAKLNATSKVNVNILPKPQPLPARPAKIAPIRTEPMMNSFKTMKHPSLPTLSSASRVMSAKPAIPIAPAKPAIKLAPTPIAAIGNVALPQAIKLTAVPNHVSNLQTVLHTMSDNKLVLQPAENNCVQKFPAVPNLAPPLLGNNKIALKNIHILPMKSSKVVNNKQMLLQKMGNKSTAADFAGGPAQSKPLISGSGNINVGNKFILPKGNFKIVPAPTNLLNQSVQKISNVPSTVVGTPAMPTKSGVLLDVSKPLNKPIPITIENRVKNDTIPIVASPGNMRTNPVIVPAMNAPGNTMIVTSARPSTPGIRTTAGNSAVQSITINTTNSNNLMNKNNINIATANNINFLNLKNVKVISNMKQLITTPTAGVQMLSSAKKVILPATTINKPVLSAVSSFASSLSTKNIVVSAVTAQPTKTTAISTTPKPSVTLVNTAVLTKVNTSLPLTTVPTKSSTLSSTATTATSIVPTIVSSAAPSMKLTVLSTTTTSTATTQLSATATTALKKILLTKKLTVPSLPATIPVTVSNTSSSIVPASLSIAKCSATTSTSTPRPVQPSITIPAVAIKAPLPNKAKTTLTTANSTKITSSACAYDKQTTTLSAPPKTVVVKPKEMDANKTVITDWEKELDGDQIVIDKNEVMKNHQYEELCDIVESDFDDDLNDFDDVAYLNNLANKVNSNLNGNNISFKSTPSNTQNNLNPNSCVGFQMQLDNKTNLGLVNRNNVIKANGEYASNKMKSNSLSTNTYQGDTKKVPSHKEANVNNVVIKMVEISANDKHDCHGVSGSSSGDSSGSSSIDKIRKVPFEKLKVAEAIGET